MTIAAYGRPSPQQHIMGQLGRIAIQDSQPFGRERVQDGVDVGAGGDRNLAVDKFRAVGEQTMTAEAPSATVRPDPARSPAPGAYPSKQRRRDGHTRRGPRAPTRTCAGPVRDDPLVIDLVTRARSGDKQAWDALVERYAPLIWSICRSHRLGVADAEDVGQRVWLYLVDQLDRIRDPAALPGWLASATRRECLRVLGAAREPLAAGYALDAETIPDEQTGTAEHELLAAERDAALREALRDLPPCGQRLILLLIEDPPVPYAEISARLGIPVGSIGPTRRRCLDKLRDHPAIAALSDAGSAAGDRGSAAAAGTVGPNAR